MVRCKRVVHRRAVSCALPAHCDDYIYRRDNMKQKYDQLARRRIDIDAAYRQGRLSYDRQMIGIGGASHLPVPESIRPHIGALKHRMVRVFLQEYFFIYPEHGRFDWSRLDAFMDSVAELGVDVLASICIKPRVLYPKLDPAVYMPNDIDEWRMVIRELVKRYSVERRLVTHWAVANEINIGESGGCPHEIKDPDEYYEFYRLTSQAILEAWPEARVGGPSVAGFDYDYLARFVKRCCADGAPLDFISYNIYSGDPEQHASAARHARELADRRGADVEVYQTELNTWFPDAYVEEVAYSGRYAASLAAVLMELNETPITGSFQFDMYDEYVDPDDFEQFYTITPFMLQHWNEVPHRFGLFDFDGRVRPQYFVYQMLRDVSGERISAVAHDEPIRTAASIQPDGYAIIVNNFSQDAGGDCVADLHMRGLERGLYRLEVYRVDDGAHWDAECMQLLPVESRLTYVLPEFNMHVLLPEDSVTFVRLTRQ